MFHKTLGNSITMKGCTRSAIKLDGTHENTIHMNKTQCFSGEDWPEHHAASVASLWDQARWASLQNEQ